MSNNRNKKLAFRVATILLAAAALPLSVVSAAPVSIAGVTWKADDFSTAPQTFPCPNPAPDGVRALYYASLPYNGQPAWTFAYVGTPAGTPPAGGWPGVVLLHGGGGTAYAEWVRRWNTAGFAAIAMDLEGHEPDAANPKLRKPTPHPGPTHSFGDAQGGDENQFPYRAVAQASLACSLLRSTPDVNPTKVGLCGISWGSIWTFLAAGVDDRFAFAIPIYGHGFLAESQAAVRVDAAKGAKWDPSVYIVRSKCPMLAVSSTNDRNFWLPLWQKTIDLRTSGLRELVVPKLVHSHDAAWEVPECYSFAREVVDHKPTVSDRAAIAAGDCKASFTPASADYWYTTSGGPWEMRSWLSKPARLDGNAAHVPDGIDAAHVRASFFQLTRTDSSRISSPISFNAAAEQLSAGPPLLAPGKGRVVLSDNFDAYPLGPIGTQGGWSATGVGATVEDAAGHGKALALGFPFTSADIPVANAGNGVVYVRFALKATPPVNSGPTASQKLLVYVKDADGKNICLFWHDCTGLWGVQSNGQYSQRPLASHSDDWTNVDLAIDQANRKLTLRLTNGGVTSVHFDSVDYSKPDAGTIAKISFVRNKEGDPGKMDIDDVAVVAAQ